MNLEEKSKKVKRISFSEYQLWKGCQHKHYLAYKLKYREPTNDILIFGTSIHAALEKYAKGEYNRILFKRVFERCLKEEIEKAENPELKIDIKQFTKQAEKIFNSLKFWETFSDYEVFLIDDQKSVEVLLLEPLIEGETEENNIYYKGFVDLLLRHKETGKLLVIDWKSAMNPWNLDKKLENKEFFGQLALYKHFIHKKLNVPLEDIETKFITLIRFGSNNVEHFKINVSDEFRNYILDDIKNSAKEIQSFTVFEKARTNSGLSTGACQYCVFKKDENLCNEHKNQQVDAEYVQKLVEEMQKSKK